jgi:hypothetical protein
MLKSMLYRLSAATEVLSDQPLALSQEKKEYVLEHVFWVPISSGSSASRLTSEMRLGSTTTESRG